jgi:hypothetical protein
MKKIIFGTIVSAAVLLGACGQWAGTPGWPRPPEGSSTKTGIRTHAKVGPYGFNANDTVLTLPHVGKASPTITKFAHRDNNFYKEIINPKDWAKSKTFGQYIFVGPYTSGKKYQQVRDAKLGAVDAMEVDVLFAQGATTWPHTIGSFNATAFNQTSAANMPSTVSVEQYDAKHYPGSAYTVNAPSIATIVESPVGIITPQMVQEPSSVAGACIPRPIAVYFKGTANPAMTGSSYDATPSYQFQEGPTNNVGGTSASNGAAASSSTSTCVTMP